MGCHESRPLKNEVLEARVFNPWILEEYPMRFFLWISICKCVTRSLCVDRDRFFFSDPNSLKYSGGKALRSKMWEGARAFSKHLSTGSPLVYFDLKDDFASNVTIFFFFF